MTNQGVSEDGPHITIQSALRPDYDSFFYRELSRRARRIYLFRGEYIFDLEKAVVIETPQLGQVRVTRKIVPAVTEVWWRQAQHRSSTVITGEFSRHPQLGQQKPSGQRSCNR